MCIVEMEALMGSSLGCSGSMRSGGGYGRCSVYTLIDVLSNTRIDSSPLLCLTSQIPSYAQSRPEATR